MMKTVRLVATILNILTRLLAVIFWAVALYAFVVLFCSLHTSITGLPIELKNNGSFVIFYPFTRTPFLLGDHNHSFFLISTSTIALYGVFLWLLSLVFKAFRQAKLFIPTSVSRLERFYLFNISVPIIFLAFLAFAGHEVRDVIIITFLHLMIGVFAFFMAAIFKQGLVLQEEQDLTF